MSHADSQGQHLRPPNPTLTVHLFPEILEHLLGLLGGLTDEHWERQTVCERWCVKDVAAHLLGVEIGNLSSRRDGHAVSSEISGWEDLVSYLNDFNEVWVAAARRMSTAVLLDLLAHAGEQVSEYFQSLDPLETGGPVSWAGSSPAPVWLDIAREYTERWCHQQHIRDAVGTPGLCEPRYLRPVLSTFSQALPRAYRSLEAIQGTVVTLTVSGESGGQWSVSRQGGEWSLYEGTVSHPDAWVMIDDVNAWRLYTRGLPTEQIPEIIVFGGDRALAEPMLQVAAIIA